MSNRLAVSPSWPAGGGMLGMLIGRHDWSATPLGALDGWSPALRTLVDLVVHSPLPTVLLWGPDLVQIYNDGYAKVCGPRHPRALGQPNAQCWPEVQAFVDPIHADVFAGRARSFTEVNVVLERHGAPEQTWFDLVYSPAYDGGTICGVFATVIETTERVRARQALQLNDERLHSFAGAGAMYRMSPDWREMQQLNGRGMLADTVAPDAGWLDRYIHPDDQAQVGAAIARAIDNRDVFEHEHRVCLADGTPGWTLLRAVPIFGADGAIREWFGTATDITERKRAQEDLRRADQRIAMALDAGAVAGTWYWDVPGDVFSADARFARSFDLDPDALRRGVPLAAVVQSIHPDDEPGVSALIGEALAHGGPYRAQYRVRQGDGGYRWLEANGQVTLDAHGRPLTFPGVLIDIDQRKRREARQAALLQLGDRLRRVERTEDAGAIAGQIVGETLGVMQAGFGRIDAAAGSVEVVRDWRADPGQPSLQGIHHFARYGSFFDDLRRGEVVAIDDVEQDPRTAAARDDFRALRVRGMLNVPVFDARGVGGMFLALHEQAHAWTDGEIAFVKGVADRTWAEMARADAVRALHGINLDLERQAAAVAADRNRLWRLSREIMLVTGFDGRVGAVNPAWTDVLGWEEGELVGASLLDLLHPDDVAHAMEAIRTLETVDRLAPNFENRYRHRDGGYRWISWNASRDADANAIVAVGRDVSDDKARAVLLAEAQERLRQSTKMEAVGQLTGGLAHDFNNLLASIGASLDLLGMRIKAGKLDDLERFVGIAQGAVRRAAALTHRLLAFSRRQPLAARALDMAALVDGILDMVRRTIGPAIALEVDAGAGLWPTLADPNQLENALLNLCINARDAMPDGGWLRIGMANAVLGPEEAARHELAPGDYVRLSVRDNGTGIAPEVAAKVFDPFFTTKPIGQGTGLGLSMIYGFARQSGGHVWLESRPGHGTAMHMVLPRHRGALQGEAEAGVAGAYDAAAASVLLVDDETALRGLMAEALSQFGHRVLEAGDAAGALRLLAAGAAVDLLVTDIGLSGGTNGRQLAEAARQLRPGLKVLFITGYAESRLVEQGSLDADSQLMTKPFELDALARRVAAMTAGAVSAA